MDFSIKGFLETSFVDWPGKIASVPFLPRCNFRCPYCHNHPLISHPEQYPSIPLDEILRYRPRTNIAHGLPTNRKIQMGDLVMIDIHPIVDGYSADICRTVCLGKPTAEQQAAYDLYLEAQQSTIQMIKAGVGMVDLEGHLHQVMKDAGHGQHIFGPPIHGVGIEFEESPLSPGHAFFHGEKAPQPLPANVVISVGNCGLYTGPWGVRVEDTNLVKPDGHETLTSYPRFLDVR